MIRAARRFQKRKTHSRWPKEFWLPRHGSAAKQCCISQAAADKEAKLMRKKERQRKERKANAACCEAKSRAMCVRRRMLQRWQGSLVAEAKASGRPHHALAGAESEMTHEVTLPSTTAAAAGWTPWPKTPVIESSDSSEAEARECGVTRPVWRQCITV